MPRFTEHSTHETLVVTTTSHLLLMLENQETTNFAC